MIRFVFPFLLFASCLQAATPTNFIQILTDDQGWGDLKSYGHVQLKTPHIDQLAAERRLASQLASGDRQQSRVENHENLDG